MVERPSAPGQASILEVWIAAVAAAKSLSRVRLFATPWTAAYQAPPPMGFSRQEYWSGVPLPSPQEYWSGLPFPSPMHESEK